MMHFILSHVKVRTIKKCLKHPYMLCISKMQGFSFLADISKLDGFRIPVHRFVPLVNSQHFM